MNSEDRQQSEKLSCNLCIFCADLKNPDGTIFCMLHRANNSVNNSCAELINNRTTQMNIKQVLELVKEKRGGKKEELKKASKKRNKTVLILIIFVSIISFIFGFIAGGAYPQISKNLLNTIKSIFQR